MFLHNNLINTKRKDKKTEMCGLVYGWADSNHADHPDLVWGRLKALKIKIKNRENKINSKKGTTFRPFFGQNKVF